MPASAPPRTRSGGKTSPGRAGSTRPSTVAPMRRSGSATRRIGRRVSEASPTSSVSNGRPASRPISSRIVVPELPQSSAPAAAVRPAKPTPWTRASSPASTMSTPSARSAAAVDRLSPPRPEPARLDGAVRERPEQQRAVRDRLVARARGRCPRSGPDRRTLQRRCLGASSAVSLPHRRAQPSRSLPVLRQRLQHGEQLLGQPLALARRRCAGGRGRAIPRPPASGRRTPARARAA